MSRKKTAEEHKINGTYRPSVHGPLPAGFKEWLAGDGPMPEAVKPAGMSDVASAMWDEVVRNRPGTVWPSDGPVLEMFCEWWALWKVALGKAQKSAASTTFTALGIATDKVEKLGAKFGLTPKDRAAMPVVEVGPKKAKVETRDKDVDRHLKPPKKR